MDKRLKQHLLALYADGLNAHDIMRQHNRQTHDELAVTTIEAVLRQQGVPDPSHRIPQKQKVQPDMPKRFVPLDGVKKREKLTFRPVPTVAQREFHNVACGFAVDGRKLLKSPSRHKLERQIVEHLERGFVQLGNITSDFDFDGTMYFAVVKKGDFS